MSQTISKRESYHNPDIIADIESINQITIIPSLLNVICHTTGMGFAAIARVSEDRWVTCSALDKIGFGLKPGDELKVETTLCHEVRQSQKVIVIDHVDKDANYCNHHTPAMYGLQSYISVPIIRKDGRFFGTLCAIDPKPAHVNKAEVIDMFTMYADLISFHLNALDQLAVSEDQLLEERKTAELREQFIAILGHDLRNPLSTIKMVVDMLIENPEEDRDRMLQLIKTTNYRMEVLIENLLDFAMARLGDGIQLNCAKHQDTLAESLTQVILELEASHPERMIESHIEIKENVYCDSSRLAQLLSSLLGNALVHGSSDKPVEVKAVSDSKEFVLSVSNAGNKIPEEAIERLFLPFSRNNEDAGIKGLGLGLFIASEIAKVHNGKLEVESSEEETRFTFSMPSE